MRRRDFLTWLAAAAAATSLRAAKGRSEPRPPIGLGFSLYGMKSLGFAEAIAACGEIGYDCVELPVQAGWPGDSAKLSKKAKDEIRAALADMGVRLSSLMENLHAGVDDARHAANLDRLKRAGELARELSPEKPPVIETILGGRPADWEKARERMSDRVTDWAKAAEATETVIAVKAHVSGAMHLPEHVVWLLEAVDRGWIRAAYDYSHFYLRDVGLEASLETLLPHTAFIHVKDGRGSLEKVQFLLPGEGETDYARLLRLVNGSSYTGDVVVEVSGQIHGKPEYDPIHAAQKSYRPLAAAFEKAGVRRG